MYLSVTQPVRVMTLMLLLMISGMLYLRAQNKPAATVIPVARAAPLPPAYNLQTINRVRTWTPSQPVTDTAWVVAAARMVKEVKMQTQYIDGLGRLLQTVDRQGSPAGRDIIVPELYDAFGRERCIYLPYVQKTGSNNGSFKSAPFAGQRDFYRDGALSPGVGADSIYYSQTGYEAAPLNRVLQTWGPGNAWAKEGGNRPVAQRYLLNTAADAVRCWNMQTGSPVPVSSRVYSAGSLYRNVVISEANVQSVTYTDKDGHTVMKKTQLAAVPGADHTGWLCTYYVYDDMGMLRFIIPPKAVDVIKGSWVIPATVAAELCFIYRYDHRLRLVVQKFPAADSVEMVYDKRDRLVARRDGIMKVLGQWYAIAYDQLNREQKTALISVADNSRQLQVRIDQLISGKDIFSFLSAAQIRVLTTTHYDDYNFPGKEPYVTTDIGKVQAGANPYAESLPGTASMMTRGLMTGKSVRVEATEQFITSTVYYNDKGRIIQTIANNMAGGRDVTNTLYDFNGKVLSTYLRHTNPRSVLTPQTTILTMYDYDAMGRLDSIKKRINDNLSMQRVIAVNTYDESGRLRTKRLDVTGPAAQLETLQYEYNIRGWLKSVNGKFVTTPNSASNWFGQEYSYEYGFDSSEYNGNIAGIKWKSSSDGIPRAYGFDYDRADRLTFAGFTQQYTGSTAWTNDKADFSVSGLTYDYGGNILSMRQRGLSGTAVRTIDSLKYGYFVNSNRLNYVTDKNNDPASLLGDFKETDNREVQDYWYDPNGNIAKDRNKSVDSVLYNHQQLPAILLAKGRKAAIYYLYAAGGGELLSKRVSDTSSKPHWSRVTHYINGFQYEQDTLQFISQEEGRIRPIYKSGKLHGFAFDYFLKDHLGNVRMVLSSEKDTAVYKATMEKTVAVRENTLFSNIEQTRTEKPVGYPEDQTAGANIQVARLNAVNGQKVGPALVLRVMAGDSIMIGVRAFYKNAGAHIRGTTPEAMLAAVLNTFNGNAAGTALHTTNGMGAAAVTFSNSLYRQLKEKEPAEDQPDKPKAYLCFAAFDDQFNLVAQNAGVKQVEKAVDVLQTLATKQLRTQKNGYVYIYTSNESGQDVYFDNLTVTHISGPLLEETHYYPFGLTMAGISSPALKGQQYPENKKRYNGIEFNAALDLNEYDAFYRTLDPQTGRWKQPDPKADKMEAWSPYVSNFNNPVRYSDFLGDQPGPGPGFFGTLRLVFNGLVNNISRQAAQNRRDNMTVIRNAVNKGVGNFKGRIATGTTTPQLIYKELMQNPLGAVTGITGLEMRVAGVAVEELTVASKAAGTGAKVAEGGEGVLKTSGKLDGAGRAAKYSEGWENGSLKGAIEKFAPGAEGVVNPKASKTMYLNSETGIQVVHDVEGNYFRIENTKLPGSRRYLDMNGKVPNNKVINGRQLGRSKGEYEQVTHFNDTDVH
jgi:RHS repeat-associated protein